MLEVKISIEAKGLEMAMLKLANSIMGGPGKLAVAEPKQVQVPVAEIASQPVREETKTVSEEVKPAEEKSATFIEVRAALAALSKSGKKAIAKKILQDFGYAKLSDANAKDYAEMLKKAEAV